ncbi:MAG TPA: glycoside hydrolase family 6 protein [Acidimicrobiales bacterium]|nr:glycoside hydrolase family 6 protein [Acidimicrobiales bacterium]
MTYLSLSTSVPAVTRRRSITILVLGLLAVAVGVLAPSSSAGAASRTKALEAETMTLTAGAGQVIKDTSASGGAGLLIWSDGSGTGALDVRSAASSLAITARGARCEGSPRMRIAVDDVAVAEVTVDATTWRTYTIKTSLKVGARRVKVRFINDHRTASCDRNLFLDVLAAGATTTSTTSSTTTTAAPTSTTTSTTTSTITTTTTTTAPTTTTTTVPAEVDPLAGERLHVSWSPATAAADEIRATNPADAARLDLLADTPTARWFGEWSGNITIAADGYVAEATRAGALPVLVTYMIPGRDCGSYSAGGAGSADAYRTWIRDLAAGIGSREAVVILEPDALAMADCLSDALEAERYQLLAEAIDVLEAGAGTTVYLDAGHAHWLGVDQLVARLRLAGVDDARGISLNVSNFGVTDAQVAYATAVADRLGTHAVIDTGRNGNGSDGTWCNPLGRAIGTFPTTDPATPPVIDALLWVKVPGESDGTCNGGPPAGQYWAEYAIDLVRNAGY